MGDMSDSFEHIEKLSAIEKAVQQAKKESVPLTGKYIKKTIEELTNCSPNMANSEVGKVSQAKRYNQGKLRWGLVDFESIKPMIKVLEYGAVTYGDSNWKKGLNQLEILESAQRHIADMIDAYNNEDWDRLNDLESGIDQSGHVMCNMMFFNYMRRNNLNPPPLNKPSE